MFGDISPQTAYLNKLTIIMNPEVKNAMKENIRRILDKAVKEQVDYDYCGNNYVAEHFCTEVEGALFSYRNCVFELKKLFATSTVSFLIIRAKDTIWWVGDKTDHYFIPENIVDVRETIECIIKEEQSYEK